jgi:large subunit ribosomal protein L16
VVKPGRMLFEIEGVTLVLAQEALGLAASKLPVRTRIVKRLED